MSEIQQNLRGWFNRITPEDKDEGEQAYVRYHNVLRNFAEYWGFGLVQTVEAFVAMSPNNDYFGNLRSLASVLHHCKTGFPYTISTYGACGRRAVSYVNGDVSFLDTVKGPKITAFRDNLLYPFTSKRVTIDGHMIAIAIGSDTTTMKQSVKLQSKGRFKYEFLESEFVTFSRKVKVRPLSLQASLWFCRKRVLGIKSSDQIDAFYGSNDFGRVMVDPRDCPPYGSERTHSARRQ